jgi:hypothetical protein
MITDIDNLCAKIDLLPISKASAMLKSVPEDGLDMAAAFMASDELMCRNRYWECVDPMSIISVAIYLKLLTQYRHPQPESDFTEEFGNIPSFFWPEIIEDALDANKIMFIIKWHKRTVASIIEYLIAALPAQMQAEAVQDSISVINPDSEYFDSLWHTVSGDAREQLKTAFPECEQATDIIQKFANVPIDDLNSEILSSQHEIKTKDCDDVTELALLRFAADMGEKHGTPDYGGKWKESKERTIEFVKTQKQVIGGASDARMESLFCRSVAITHKKVAPAVKKYLSEQFAHKDDELILCDAPAKMRAIAMELNKETAVYYGLHSIFDSVAVNIPLNTNVSELLLAFRIAILSSNKQSDMEKKAVPELISRQDGVSDEFFWRFRCDYGISVLGIMPPEQKFESVEACDYELSVAGILLPKPKPESFEVIETKPDVIDISKKNAAMVFAALYNYAWPQGMGFSQYIGIPMSAGDAHQIMNRYDGKFTNYLMGRAMMLSISNQTKILDVGMYNKDNGKGMAQRAIRTVPNTR